MKNYSNGGSLLPFIAPMGGVVSGGFYAANGRIYCATKDADAGDTVIGKISGAFRVAKTASQAWTTGVAVYLVGGSHTTFSTSSGGNTLAGWAAAGVGGGAGEIEGEVLLNGLPDTPDA